MRTAEEIEDIYERRVDMVYRVAYNYMRSPTDTEDIVQDVFVRLLTNNPSFRDSEHEKAWLIRVTINICKNKLKDLSQISEMTKTADDATALRKTSRPEEEFDLKAAILKLPEKYKGCVYLHYYESYTSVEIAEILHKPVSSVRNLLFEARKTLRLSLGRNYKDEK